jgi:hypothetical protein
VPHGVTHPCLQSLEHMRPPSPMTVADMESDVSEEPLSSDSEVDVETGVEAEGNVRVRWDWRCFPSIRLRSAFRSAFAWQ